jgi:hypothetical protein
MPDPDEPAVTDWFPITVNPAHVGGYQITNNTSPNWPFPQYATWDGKKWNVEDVVSWRGLANKPE